MNKQDEQQERNRASMSMLQKMSDWIDKQLEADEELERLEREWQSRCIKPTTDDEEIE